jgi:hypothetical protein
MAIIYSGDNPMILSRVIRHEIDSGFLATGHLVYITGLLQTGVAANDKILKNHLGREYFKRLNTFNLNSYINDDYDAGFRPKTFTGLYN